MKVHAITLGCQMSAADGAEALAQLCRHGWQATEAPAQADAILLTTCTVRRHAEQRALSLIGRLREWKAQDPRRLLVVAGCVAERMGRKLSRRFPHVDLVLGARQAGRYGELVAAALAERSAAQGPAEPGPGASAAAQTLTIMRGCSCGCSYCVVPSVRGPELCRPAEEVVAEAQARLAQGARELTLLGQRVNAYRDGDLDFAGLLRRLDSLAGLRRLRFMSPHPALCDERLAEAVRDCRSVCEAVHLPAQSGSDRILGLMRRGYGREGFLETVARLRRVAPAVEVSTDIIVGFPSETDRDFAETLTLLERLRPVSAFCFKYSAREGTAASALPEQLPEPEKERRLAAVNAVVERFMTQVLDAQVGQIVEVLAETPTFGRTRTGLKARWGRPVAPGELVSLRVGAATRRTLLGDIHEPHDP